MPTLTPGKMRGLATCSTDQQHFTILAVDHGASLAGTIRPESPQTVGYHEMIAVKGAILSALTPAASAALLDPVYGLAPAVMGGALLGRAGLLLAVEDGDYASVEKEARLFPGWQVAQAKKAGANAIKCFFYYHPDDETVAAHQERFVRQLVEDCHRHDLPLFAEPLSYATTPETRQAVVVETARRISRLGIDVLKCEFPFDIHHDPQPDRWRAACESLSEVCVTPWALLSAGVDFDSFAAQVEVAARAGASGYLAGRAIWKEAVSLDGDARDRFLDETATARLRHLADIAARTARPWTDFYPYATEMPQQGWHQTI